MLHGKCHFILINLKTSGFWMRVPTRRWCALKGGSREVTIQLSSSWTRRHSAKKRPRPCCPVRTYAQKFSPEFLLFIKFWRTSDFFVGSLIPLFWTSGDVCPLTRIGFFVIEKKQAASVSVIVFRIALWTNKRKQVTCNTLLILNSETANPSDEVIRSWTTHDIMEITNDKLYLRHAL